MKRNKCCVLILTAGVSKDFITQGAGTGYSFFIFLLKRVLNIFIHSLFSLSDLLSLYLTDAEVLWSHGACVHSCNAPPGLWGAAVLHPEVEATCRHEPCGGQRPAAS